MGSVFLIIIPTRSHEFHLRLAESEIYALPATPLNPRDQSHSHASLLNLLKVEKLVKSSPSQGQGTKNNEAGDEVIAWDITLPTTKDVVKAYKIDHNGKILLEVSRDGMKLTHAGKVGSCPPCSEKKRSGGGLSGMSSDSDKEKISNAAKLGSNTLQAPAPIQRQGGRKLSSIYRMDDCDEVELTELTNNQFLEKHMEEALSNFELLNATWDHTIDEKFSQIMFTVKAEFSDEIINHLHGVGIGKKYHSTLSVVSAAVFTQETDWRKSQDSDMFDEQWNGFVQSIKARLTVAQVVQSVKADAVITFDYIMMIIVAAVIAALGLLENSSVNLIASMLVSPLMGPIMAFTFGAMIRDKSLVKIGVKSEAIGLLICQLVGFFMGILVELRFFTGPWNAVLQWPTGEMSSRSELKSLIVGAFIAIPSGAGIALSILSGNAGSLVGVAISASLLPPCVNCGLLYGLAFVIACRDGGTSSGCNDNIQNMSANDPRIDLWRNHRKIYCANALHEYAIMGSVSLCLTLLNIALIFVTGSIVLKIKEVAPHTTKRAVERFWKQDVKTAREFNKTHLGENALLENIYDTRGVLKTIEEDYVFNQVKNRFPQENVLKRVKTMRKNAKSFANEGSGGGWLSWFGGSSHSSH